MSEQFKRFSQMTVWVTLILFVIRCFLSWQELIVEISLYDLYGYAGEAIAFSAVVMAIYEKWVWRIIPLGTPVLKKHYSGTLKSSYDGVERSATLDIRQTFLSIHVIMKSDESRSRSVSASLDDISGETQLTYCYLNEPRIEFRDRSDIHYGTALLCVNDPQNISGKYYTDRCTRGDMIFRADG